MSLSVHAILFCERPSVTINQSYASDKTLAWVSLINYKKVACSDKASCDLKLVSIHGKPVTTAFFNDVNGVEHVANDEDVYCIVFNDNKKIIGRACNTPRTVICEDPCSVAEGILSITRSFDCFSHAFYPPADDCDPANGGCPICVLPVPIAFPNGNIHLETDGSLR